MRKEGPTPEHIKSAEHALDEEWRQVSEFDKCAEGLAEIVAKNHNNTDLVVEAWRYLRLHGLQDVDRASEDLDGFEVLALPGNEGVRVEIFVAGRKVATRDITAPAKE